MMYLREILRIIFQSLVDSGKKYLRGREERRRKKY